MMSADNDNAQKKNDFGRKLAATALAVLLALPSAGDVFAATSSGRIGGSSFRSTSSPVSARSGGRVGGGSFRRAPAPSRGTYGGGGRGVYGGYGGYGGYTGGLFSPVMPVMPFYFSPFGGSVVVGGGGGGLIGALAVAGAAYVLLRGVAFRSGINDDDEVGATSDVAVVTLKLGLLSSATRVRDTLDSLAYGGDTSTSRGLARVLGDAVVALMRSSDYWVCGSTDVSVARFSNAERTFNDVAVRERSKLARETLSNVSGERRSIPNVDTSGSVPEEYVVVTLVAAADSAVARNLPRRIDSASDVRTVLSALGSVSGDQMQALEVLWAPQVRGDSLTRSEMLLDHPELRDFA